MKSTEIIKLAKKEFLKMLKNGVDPDNAVWIVVKTYKIDSTYLK